MTYQLGVDLGTTYSAAAINRDGRVEIVTLSAAFAAMPSIVVLRDDNELIVGEAALRRGLQEPTRMAREFKRRLGDPAPLVLGRVPFSAEALMSALLREIVSIVTSREGEAPDHVVLTHPANYGPYKLEMMNEVVRLSGLDVRRTTLLPEPQAAAISYSMRDRVAPGTNVAVYDLGGGTFDAAILRRTETGFDLIGQPEGLDRFGGIDIDAAILAYIDEQFDGELLRVDADDPVIVSALQRLRDDCTAAKEALSTDTDTSIDVSVGALHRRIRLNRSELESMTFARLRDTTEALRRTVANAGLQMDDIDKVLLVGGSSRMPLVGELVARSTTRPVVVDAHPKFAIALGAAGFNTAAQPSVEPVVANDVQEAMPPPPPPPTSQPVMAPAPPPPPKQPAPGPKIIDTRPRSTRRRARTQLAVGGVIAALVAGGVVLALTRGNDDDKGSGSPTTNGGTSPSTASSSGSTQVPASAVSLAGDCPETVVIQTDWLPEAEQGFIYEMLGAGYSIDAATAIVRGPLVDAAGNDTGVQLEIRSGGQPTGFVSVSSIMYDDDEVLLGTVYTDEAVSLSATTPTVAIASGLEKNPQAILWDPATYPDVTDIAGLGAVDAKVFYFGGSAFMDYLVGSGQLSAGQIDGSYQGIPTQFLDANGTAAIQGFGSAEPYVYEHEVTGWLKPLRSQYLNDAGWTNYAMSIATKPGKIDTFSACFRKLVPIIQAAGVGYSTDPTRANAIIIEAVDAFAANFNWVYSSASADAGASIMRADGLLANGPGGTMGKFDLARVDDLIGKAAPIFESKGMSPKTGLTAADIVTNQFIDDSIGL